MVLHAKKHALLQQQEKLDLAKPTQKLLIMKTEIQSLSKKLHGEFSYIVEQKINQTKQIELELKNAMLQMMTRKRAMLNFNLNDSMQNALRTKKTYAK